MKQKFLRGYEVKICDKMPSYMFHFDCGCNAIVDGTYSERYGGKDIKSYSLLLLNKDRIPYECVAWYEESQLTLISDNILKGYEILENYNFCK